MAASRVWRVARDARMEAREEASYIDEGGADSSTGTEADVPLGRPVGGIGWGSAWEVEVILGNCLVASV